MSTIDEVKGRLNEAGTPFALVKGAADLAAVKDMPTALPAAYVLIAREATAENDRATGPVSQRVERDLMVVIVAQDLSDPEGGAAADLVETLKSHVRGKLIGFVPTDMSEPITHVAGEMVQAAGGAVWFEDVFSAPFRLTETN